MANNGRRMTNASYIRLLAQSGVLVALIGCVASPVGDRMQVSGGIFELSTINGQRLPVGIVAAATLVLTPQYTFSSTHRDTSGSMVTETGEWYLVGPFYMEDRSDCEFALADNSERWRGSFTQLGEVLTVTRGAVVEVYRRQ